MGSARVETGELARGWQSPRHVCHKRKARNECGLRKTLKSLVAPHGPSPQGAIRPHPGPTRRVADQHRNPARLAIRSRVRRARIDEGKVWLRSTNQGDCAPQKWLNFS